MTGLALVLCFIIVLSCTEWQRVESMLAHPGTQGSLFIEDLPPYESNLPTSPHLKEHLPIINGVGVFLAFLAMYGLFTLLVRLDSSMRDAECIG